MLYCYYYVVVYVLLFNFGDEDFEVKYGDRIAQFIVEKISVVDIEEVDELEETVRGDGAFGSTGVRLTDTKNDDKKEEANGKL